jgi:hypothetical protein
MGIPTHGICPAAGSCNEELAELAGLKAVVATYIRLGGEMTAAQLDEQRKARADEVFSWRLEQLIRAGYDRHDAGHLAHRTDIDLHQAVELLCNGCSPELALAILR